MRIYICLIICLFLSFTSTGNAKKLTPKDELRDSVLNRIFDYSSHLDTTGLHSHKTSYNYTKFQMRTNRRNATLMLVPTMYTIAHGAGRRFMGEYYSKVTFTTHNKLESKRLLNITTIPHRRNTMSAVLTFLTPNIYGESLFQGNILSPFHRTNRRYYIYSVTPLPFGKAQVYVYPRLKNTQVVSCMAIVDTATGRINLADFEGEYDMTRFSISVVMNKEGYRSRFPKKCDLRANFRFMGNQITAKYTSIYGLPKVISDTLDNVEDTVLMNKVRPIPLNDDEQSFIDHYFEEKARRDSLSQSDTPKKNFAKDILWDVIGDNVLNDIRQNFGKQKQGYFRLDPIFNPLYMGYTHRKGYIYKFDIRGNYAFNDDVELELRFRASYSFKQHQFYFHIPATFRYSNKHNGYLQMEFGNGNRINSNVVARRILDISMPKDSLIKFPWAENYTEFKDTYLRLTNHWMFSSRFGFELGLIAHHRTAVTPEFYIMNNFPYSYRSVAPAIGLVCLPWGTKGPIFKIDYERSIKGFLKSNIEYERIEMDAQAILYASRRRSFSLRSGAGFYTMKGEHWDFVDYTNFRDNNIPGGWNDDWSGDFELLNSDYYNASDYYLRSNATYEAPMLFAAWLPFVGRYIEKERLYVNALLAHRLYPYTEWGYGFTSRLISIGMFAAFRNEKFEGVGCKFSFELFRHW